MATITSTKKLTGWVLGAHFTDGKAESDAPATVSAFRKLAGYTVTEPKKVSLKKAGEDGDGA